MEAFHAERPVTERDERRGLAFMLALGVHALLAVFLFVSVQWRTQKAETVSVELWGGPPPAPPAATVQPEPKPVPKVIPPPEPRPEPEPVRKPEIVEERIRKPARPVEKPQPASVAKAVEKPKTRAEPKPEPKAVARVEPRPEPKKVEPKKTAPTTADALSQALSQALNERNSAATPGVAGGKAGGTGTNAGANTGPGGAAGGGGLGDQYLGQVIRLIKANLVYSGNKAENAKARLKVFLLPDGTIREVQLLKALGDPAYAEAAKRAVITTHTFPPQPGGKPFSGNLREWTLNFCAREGSECRID